MGYHLTGRCKVFVKRKIYIRGGCELFGFIVHLFLAAFFHLYEKNKRQWLVTNNVSPLPSYYNFLILSLLSNLKRRFSNFIF